MQVDFDFDRLKLLLDSFWRISGIRYSLSDAEGRLVCCAGESAPFCRMIARQPDGYARCVQSDAAAIERERGSRRPYAAYRCHAGLLEAIIPIRQDGTPVAYVFFGQCIGAESAEKQWRVTRELIDWIGDPDDLKQAFLLLRQLDAETLQACARILTACSSDILLEGVIRSANLSDEQLLSRFVNERYAESLTLEQIAGALSMSKTKLCTLASKQGTTVKQMIASKRIEAAKRLLRNSSEPICEIARRVGVDDCNYFSKFFKLHTGLAPREYRAKRAQTISNRR